MIKTYIKLFFLLLLLSVVSISVGVSEISYYELLDISSNTWLILLSSRVPRLLALLIVGASLAICGVIMQHTLHNKFIEPGTSGGLDAAKLGILISITLVPNLTTIEKMFFAFLFCFVFSLIYIIIIKRINLSNNVVMVPIIGLIYGCILNAVAEFYAYRNNILQSMQSWVMGDFSKVVQGHYELIYLVIPVVILTYIYAKRFTIIGMGEEGSNSLGVNYILVLILGLIITSITVSITIITVGYIPFIGIIVPNVVAMFYGENLNYTLPIVAIGGAIVLIIADILSRILIYPFEIPIGLTVGSIGSIVFLMLILKKSN